MLRLVLKAVDPSAEAVDVIEPQGQAKALPP